MPRIGGEALAERARLWAEQAVEGMEMPEGGGPSDAECAARGCSSCIVKMEAITHALASAFIMGYDAAWDDQLPRRALVDKRR